MAHSHAHAEGEGTYFLDQLFTILVCGSVGLVAVLMYRDGTLGRILVPMFFKPVMFGGLAILALVVIRAVAVWQLAGARRAEALDAHDAHAGHDHGHAHGHDTHENCGHDHGHGPDTDCGHDHGHSHSHSHAHAHAEVAEDDHGHDHGWAPWRYMVLAIPIFLYFLGLPRAGLTGNEKDRLNQGTLQQGPKRLALAALAGGPALTKALRKTEPQRLTLRFKELTEAAAIPSRHEIYEGDIGVLRGQYIPMKGDREFTLLRVNMTCCAADQVMLEIRIEAPDAIQGIRPEQWVQVEGLISFQQNEKGKWIPVLTLRSNDDIDPNVQATTSMEEF